MANSLTQLKELELTCSGKDVRVLKNFTQLTRLRLNIWPNKRLNKRLNKLFRENPKFSKNLTRLGFEFGIATLSNLDGVFQSSTDLEEFNLRCGSIETLNGLENLVKLKTLGVDFEDKSDVSLVGPAVLKKLSNLGDLRFGLSQIDISLSPTSATDLALIFGRLESLSVEVWGFLELQNLNGILPFCTNLRKLSIEFDNDDDVDDSTTMITSETGRLIGKMDLEEFNLNNEYPSISNQFHQFQNVNVGKVIIPASNWNRLSKLSILFQVLDEASLRKIGNDYVLLKDLSISIGSVCDPKDLSEVIPFLTKLKKLERLSLRMERMANREIQIEDHRILFSAFNAVFPLDVDGDSLSVFPRMKRFQAYLSSVSFRYTLQKTCLGEVKRYLQLKRAIHRTYEQYNTSNVYQKYETYEIKPKDIVLDTIPHYDD